MKKMLSKITVLLAIGFVVLAATPAFAQTSTISYFKVPFPFLVGAQAFPAGDYAVRVNTAFHALDIRSLDGALTSYAPLMTPGVSRSGKEEGRAYLGFAVYGEKRVLRTVWTTGATEGYGLPASKAEKEMARAAGAATGEVTIR